MSEYRFPPKLRDLMIDALPEGIPPCLGTHPI
jgi:hypothetical protein